MRNAGTFVLLLLALLPGWLAAQERAVDDSPYVLLDASALQDLVAPIALYPDDLVAILLPASTYPLQVVQAARFSERGADDNKPDEAWDETVVALLNYPEALQLLNDDLDWTWRLGEAVLYQEKELLQAVSTYRKLARDSGNLKSDEHQVVDVDDGHITIKPAREREVYIPYYDPTEATVVHTTRVIHHYPRAYPLYYYPYEYGHTFGYNSFWGVATWYGIGWSGWRLHRLHHSTVHHPYFSHSYKHHYYRTRPYRSGRRYSASRFHDDNAWRPQHRRYGARPGDRLRRSHYDRPRYERSRHRANQDRRRQDQARRTERRETNGRRAERDRRESNARTNQRRQERVGRRQRDIDMANARGRMGRTERPVQQRDRRERPRAGAGQRRSGQGADQRGNRRGSALGAPAPQIRVAAPRPAQPAARTERPSRVRSTAPTGRARSTAPTSARANPPRQQPARVRQQPRQRTAPPRARVAQPAPRARAPQRAPAAVAPPSGVKRGAHPRSGRPRQVR